MLHATHLDICFAPQVFWMEIDLNWKVPLSAVDPQNHEIPLSDVEFSFHYRKLRLGDMHYFWVWLVRTLDPVIRHALSSLQIEA